MNIKAYIDYFDEIADLKRDKQFTLLEQARDEIVGESTFSIFNLVSYFFPLTFVVIAISLTLYFYGYSIFGGFISVLISLLLSRIAVTEINSRLMRKGLNKVLADSVS